MARTEARFYFSPNFLSFFLTCSCFLTVLSEFYLGKNFATALLAGCSSFLLILIGLAAKKILLPKPQAIIFVLFILWSIFASIFSQDITQSLWENMRLISTLLIFLSAYHLSSFNDQSKNTIKSFVLLGGAIIFIGLLLSILGSRTEQVFFSGLFPWHNQLAGFLLLLIPLSLVSVENYPKKFLNIALVFILFSSVLSLFLTHSRGGWLIFAVQVFFLFFIFKKNIKKYLTVFIILGTAATIASFIYEPTVAGRVTSLFQESSPLKILSENPRSKTWQISMEIGLAYPLFGVGSGAFGSVYASFQDDPWLYSLNSHNHFLQVLAETGFIGFFIYLFLLGSIFKTLLKKRQKNTALYYGLLVSTFGIFLHSLFDYDFSTVSLFSFFWLLLGISLGMTKNEYATINLSRHGKLLFPVLGIFLFFIICLEISEDAYYQAKYSFTSGDLKVMQGSVLRSLKFNPLNGRAYTLSSEIHYAKKDYKTSEKHALKATGLLPYEGSAYTILGAIAANNGDYNKAVRSYEKAISLKPFANPNSYAGLAYSYQKRGESEKAEDVLTDAIENKFPLNNTFKGFEYAYFQSGLTQDLANLYIMLGRIKLENNEPQEAEKLFDIVKQRLTSKSAAN